MNRKKKPEPICEWCGPEVPTPAIRKIILADMEGVVLDSVKLCESCCSRSIALIHDNKLDAGD